MAATFTQPVKPAPYLSQYEIIHWNSVKDSRDPLVIETYLDKYPQGQFSGLAKVLVANAKHDLAVKAQRNKSGASAQVTRASPEHAEQTASEANQATELMRAQAEAERKKLLADKSKQISLVIPRTSFETETSLSGAPITGTMTVKDMQTALKSKGCYSGKADGIWGRKSKDALRNAIGSKLADRGLTVANLKAVQSSNDCIQNVRSKPKPTPNQLGSKNGTTGTKAATRHSSKQQATAGSGRRRDRPDPVALSRRYRSYILHSEGDVDINTKYGRMTCYAVTNRRICKWR